MKINSGKSSLLDNILWLHRLYGTFDYSAATIISESIFKLLQSKNLPEYERERSLEFLLSILRQLLAFYPMDSDLMKVFIKASSLITPKDFDTNWINLLRRLLREEDSSWKQEKDKVFSQYGDDLDSLSQVVGSAMNPILLYEGVLKFWKAGRWDLCIRAAYRLLKTPYAPIVGALLGFAALSADDLDRAKEWAHVALSSFLKSNLRAEIAAREGNKEEARRWWSDSLKREPLQLWIYHRLWELEQPLPQENLLEGKKIFIFLYTFNKLEETLKTFLSLMSSKIGSSNVVIMNNGSTNFSAEEFELAIKKISGSYPVTIIHLPVNIGAPAARNWLWYLPEVQEADYIAYLDDDVILPKDWLIYYLQDMELFPNVVVVGPKVYNPGSVRTIQYIYRFFDETGERKIRFTPTAPFPLDLGQYSFRRPCLSVMGCCHLFDRRRWERFGIPDFDICFSPSQVDDLEHDIQIWKHGGMVLYDGRVEVIHLQEAGRMLTLSRASWAHVLGNHMKMEAKFSGEELASIDRAVRDVDDNFFHKIYDDIMRCNHEV
ncbi:MAG: glycosyltransferase [Syntrophobacterales bacterium]|nr:glycosyltransferase [Syntrophobacterales bacterium]